MCEAAYCFLRSLLASLAGANCQLTDVTQARCLDFWEALEVRSKTTPAITAYRHRCDGNLRDYHFNTDMAFLM